MQPYKFTPERATILTTAISCCAPRETAAKLAGITSKTLRNWLQAAEAEGASQELTDWAKAFLKAEAEVEENLIRSIVEAGRDDWRASAWVLERRFKRSWTMREEQQENGALDVTIRLKGDDAGPGADEASD